ncbi:aldehyde-activating protein [Shewanella sp. OPT22]|nr:aldehyde-activating protein [Shewanella sp. OPT22]
MEQHKGSCLCGKVRIIVNGALADADACHCDQCRKWSGHFLVSTEAERNEVVIEGEEHVKWFESSERARRGFCENCGSALFFDPLDKNKHSWTGICMGLFDTQNEVKLSHHIFVSEKGEYYNITDGLPQNQT